ncbi:phosphoribosylanthranilate isomerase [Epibacterium sp. SM1979]|uniref:N-(5'-phosphoribosyl)anthranilate isomerase n=1 Tax=Tritonibacter litoralis TaxID=2662264 RepID=A0A843YJX2_9RHOB|nr:phosphoribosylanthranilate isomerase [Tritonibacter litoralis]MQQ08997.1 phosphoribosylanthranilate isomerase [Tritonibacter litoralis]
MTEIRSKICGLKTAEDIQAAAEAGAAYIGFNFFPKSPRSVTVAEAAALAVEAPVGLCKVALVVNMDDTELDAIVAGVPLDMLQLHGHESPERVAELKARHGLPVMKVLGISEPADLARIAEYEQVADQILVDAKAPKGAVLPGGNGVTFDWSILAKKKYWQCPWMLAGGLTPENVGQAIRRTGARQVDVASGVESAPGQKDPDLIRAFVAAASGR